MNEKQALEWATKKGVTVSNETWSHSFGLTVVEGPKGRVTLSRNASNKRWYSLHGRLVPPPYRGRCYTKGDALYRAVILVS